MVSTRAVHNGPACQQGCRRHRGNIYSIQPGVLVVTIDDDRGE